MNPSTNIQFNQTEAKDITGVQGQWKENLNQNFALATNV